MSDSPQIRAGSHGALAASEDGRPPVGTRTPRTLHERAQRLAERDGRKIQATLDQALSIGLDWLEAHPAPAPPNWRQERIEASA